MIARPDRALVTRAEKPILVGERDSKGFDYRSYRVHRESHGGVALGRGLGNCLPC
jgi:hypothetical protein